MTGHVTFKIHLFSVIFYVFFKVTCDGGEEPVCASLCPISSISPRLSGELGEMERLESEAVRRDWQQAWSFSPSVGVVSGKSHEGEGAALTPLITPQLLIFLCLCVKDFAQFHQNKSLSAARAKGKTLNKRSVDWNDNTIVKVIL